MLSNPLEEDILDKFKPELMVYLKEKLNNGRLRLAVEFGKVSTVKKIYTNKEKLNYLIGKAPLLGKLRNRLGLDADF